jgi:hypothetical protein
MPPALEYVMPSRMFRTSPWTHADRLNINPSLFRPYSGFKYFSISLFEIVNDPKNVSEIISMLVLRAEVVKIELTPTTIDIKHSIRPNIHDTGKM